MKVDNISSHCSVRPVGKGGGGGVQGGACAPPFEINGIHKPQYPSHEACADVLNCSHIFHDIVVDLNLLA